MAAGLGDSDRSLQRCRSRDPVHRGRTPGHHAVAGHARGSSSRASPTTTAPSPPSCSTSSGRFPSPPPRRTSRPDSAAPKAGGCPMRCRRPWPGTTRSSSSRATRGTSPLGGTTSCRCPTRCSPPEAASRAGARRRPVCAPEPRRRDIVPGWRSGGGARKHCPFPPAPVRTRIAGRRTIVQESGSSGDGPAATGGVTNRTMTPHVHPTEPRTRRMAEVEIHAARGGRRSRERDGDRHRRTAARLRRGGGRRPPARRHVPRARSRLPRSDVASPAARSRGSRSARARSRCSNPAMRSSTAR